MTRTIRSGKTAIEYELTQTDRRSVECRVEEQGVRVFAPKAMRPGDIDAFVENRAGWILEAQRKLAQRALTAREKLENGLKEGAMIPVEGKSYALRLLPGARRTVRLQGGEILVAGTDGSAESVRVALREFLIDRAKTRFSERVQHFAPLVGRAPNRITLREQKTKWGSCSGKGNLNFNWRLIMAPPEALDYVVLHELCHLIEMNHSPAFWAQVEKHMPDYKRWQDLLKKGIQSPV